MKAIYPLLCALLLVCCKKEEERPLRTVEFKVLGNGYQATVIFADGSELGLINVDNVAHYEMEATKGHPVKMRVTGYYSGAAFNAYISVNGGQLTHVYGHSMQTVVAEGIVP